LNPEIKNQAGESKMSEGCLSLPGVNVRVSRSKDIHVQGYDACGKKRVYQIGGLWAHVVQHEIDHLNGVLICDYSSNET
jgi:peptide deformylase